MAGVEEEPSQARRFPRTLEGSRREPASAERCGFVTEGETYNAARPADGRLPVPENLDVSHALCNMGEGGSEACLLYTSPSPRD